ncbi:LamB/YcsF family protein [Pseudophaeobacter leonis]|uniref:LamB/YcsF family protein n=1 Tax=Pseudophaeobacter leonis TaxID=1144477 RepID=UPI0009F48ABC|nr:5-oxoprolinase subunit PxpA [Pseudophaeobacter leonis]
MNQSDGRQPDTGKTVDLNADMGESFGPWNMGDDSALLDVVVSANIACGFHAGEPDVMAQTMALARDNGVGIGAHPGFPDLQGFGRRKMQMSPASLGNMVRYQLGAARGMATALGTEVRHLKLHGALSNMACVDHAMARACYEAALEVDPAIIIMVLAATAMEEVVRDLGCNWCGEIFADRAYNDDATLVDRSLPGAVIHDPAVAGPRILKMVEEGAIITESGKRIPTAIDTICLHGDTPSAVALARAVRQSLTAGGVEVRQFAGRRG